MRYHADYEYLDLATKVLRHGTVKKDRTGTGTISLFGLQMEFDLEDGFPLLTTKKLPFRVIAEELSWFLNGRTDLRSLLDRNVNIWNADAYRWHRTLHPESTMSYERFLEVVKQGDEDFLGLGDLGPIYGHQWVHWGAKLDKVPQPKPQLRDGVKPTYLGVANGAGVKDSPLGKTWEGVIARCYDRNNISYPLYGAKGVHVSNDWLEFKQFEKEVMRIPGWDEKANSDVRYVLDKDTLGDGFTYSKDTCCWVTDLENNLAKSSKMYTVEKDGVEYKFTNPTQFCREHDISDKNFSDLWTGNKNAKKRYGFTLVRVDDLKKKGINQLQQVIEQIRKDPDGRRHIVSAWNPGQLKYMALPPCHVMFQFYVENGRLSCKMYQRSADIFLGVPFNIASYALLTHIIAKMTGLKVGRFIHTFGDVHIYLNHVEQIKEQMVRDPRPMPKLEVLTVHDRIEDYTIADLKLTGYDPHDVIRGNVSVGH